MQSTPRGQHVLIVDDEPFLREALGMILQQEGYTVAMAENGRVALEYLRGAVLPTLILLDWLMPVMNGQEFRRRQLQDPVLASIPVIIFTADDEERSPEFTEAAMRIRKPMNLAKLLETIRQVCIHAVEA